MTTENYEGVKSSNWLRMQPAEVVPGIYERRMWDDPSGQKASVLEFEPGAKFPFHTHLSGPEQLYVISGTLNDGQQDYNEGSFIHNPVGSAHVPHSKTGCVVLVLFHDS